MARMLVISIMLILQAAEAYSQQPAVLVPKGLLTGQEYLGLGPLEQRRYIAGLTDGYLFSPVFGGKNAELPAQKLKSCLQDMNDVQLAAIYSKFLTDNPAKWHHQAHGTYFQALVRVCGDFLN